MENNIFISEDVVIYPCKDDGEKGYRQGGMGVVETFTDSVGELFRHLQKEHGRCISKLYCDDKQGNAHCYGWVFQKKEQYTDCKEYYIKETWITLHEKEPATSTEYYKMEIAV